MAGHWVCIARLDDPDTVAKAIGPFTDEAAAQAHLDDATARGLIDPGLFTATITDDPAITDDTNVRTL
jgi:hypothetical protein